jgi:hypothetical protein
LIKAHPKKLLLFLLAFAVLGFWIYWNHPVRDDMSAYVPSDSLGFIEANDLPSIADGIVGTEAWRALAGPLGAPSKLFPHRWLIGLARWTGIGSVDAVLAARSQAVLVFTQAQAKESDGTLTIKPLAALIIQTHTTQRRMRPALEKHIGQLAQRAYGQPTLTQKQVNGVDFIQWSSAENSRRIVLAFVDTVAIVGNDESVVLHCVDVRRGKQPSLSGEQQLAKVKQQISASGNPLFGYVPKAGVKPIIQAWTLSRAGSSAEAGTVSQLISSMFGNLIDSLAWTSNFESGGVEDRCLVTLAEGVADKLTGSFATEPLTGKNDFPFVPPDAASVTSYQLRDPNRFWQDLNTIVSAHTDALTAVAARPLLRGLLEPYGINEADAFFPAIGTRLQVIRLDTNGPAVLVAEVFDRPALIRLAQKRVGTAATIETIGEASLEVSKTDNWCVAFDGNYFLSGPADAVRRCINSKAQSQSISADSSFRRAMGLVDVTLPITALTFTNDRAAAISFVESFSDYERSAFSANAAAIQQGSESLSYAVSVTMLKSGGLEWTSRSSFGLAGSLFTTFTPEKAR